MSRSPALLVAVVVGLSAPTATGQSPLYTWNFDGPAPVPTSWPVDPQPDNLALSPFARYGVNAEDRANVLASTGWPTATVADRALAVGFDAVPQPATVLHLTTVDFRYVRNTAGPRSAVAWVEAAGQDLAATATLTPSTGNLNATLAVHVVTADPVQVRWTAWQATSAAGSFWLDNVAVNGTAQTTSTALTLSADTRLFAGSTDFALSGGVTGAFALTKTGAGTITLSGPIGHTGGTTVSEGTLLLNGTHAAGVTVSGGTLGGKGVIGGPLAVQSGGTVAPGVGVGTLLAGTTTWAGGGAYSWQLADVDGLAGVGFDQLQVNGLLTVTATAADPFRVDLGTLSNGGLGPAANFDPTRSYVWSLATATGGVSGFAADRFSLNPSGFGNPLGSGAFSVALSADGRAVNLVYTPGSEPVPEPAGVLAVAVAALGAVGLARRRLRRAGNDVI